MIHSSFRILQLRANERKPSDDSDDDESVRSLKHQHHQNASRLERDENGTVIGMKKEVSQEELQRKADKKAWKEAKKARYVRTAEKREMERELTVAEMFGSSEKEFATNTR